MCALAKGLKLLEEKSSGNTCRLAFLYPPVGRDLGSGMFSFGRQCMHWSHQLGSKEYPQNMPSPPWEERASAFPSPKGWGEGGVKSPYLKASTICAEPQKS